MKNTHFILGGNITKGMILIVIGALEGLFSICLGFI